MSKVIGELKIGTKIYSVGTVGNGCDNRIWEETITGNMKVDIYGHLTFSAIDENETICWHRFSAIGGSIFGTKEEANKVLIERMTEYMKGKRLES